MEFNTQKCYYVPQKGGEPQKVKIVALMVQTVDMDGYGYRQTMRKLPELVFKTPEEAAAGEQKEKVLKVKAFMEKMGVSPSEIK